MEGNDGAYWRVREEVYRAIAASSSAQARATWTAIAERCARQAAQPEQSVGALTSSVRLPDRDGGAQRLVDDWHEALADLEVSASGAARMVHGAPTLAKVENPMRAVSAALAICALARVLAAGLVVLVAMTQLARLWPSADLEPSVRTLAVESAPAIAQQAPRLDAASSGTASAALSPPVRPLGSQPRAEPAATATPAAAVASGALSAPLPGIAATPWDTPRRISTRTTIIPSEHTNERGRARRGARAIAPRPYRPAAATVARGSRSAAPPASRWVAPAWPGVSGAGGEGG